ncbi:hypothetical protein HK11_10475 [Acetobacter sp. DmW_043]|nr:hypothetical protein HK11_10475 [Acetobacter sp. DmW_043]
MIVPGGLGISSFIISLIEGFFSRICKTCNDNRHIYSIWICILCAEKLTKSIKNKRQRKENYFIKENEEIYQFINIFIYYRLIIQQ